jgi:hypothetical protein
MAPLRLVTRRLGIAAPLIAIGSAATLGDEATGDWRVLPAAGDSLLRQAVTTTEGDSGAPALTVRCDGKEVEIGFTAAGLPQRAIATYSFGAGGFINSAALTLKDTTLALGRLNVEGFYIGLLSGRPLVARISGLPNGEMTYRLAGAAEVLPGIVSACGW